MERQLLPTDKPGLMLETRALSGQSVKIRRIVLLLPWMDGRPMKSPLVFCPWCGARLLDDDGGLYKDRAHIKRYVRPEIKRTKPKEDTHEI